MRKIAEPLKVFRYYQGECLFMKDLSPPGVEILWEIKKILKKNLIHSLKTVLEA